MGVLAFTTTIIVALITSIGGPLALVWYKNKKSPKKPTIDEENEADFEVDNQFKELAKKLKFDNNGNVWIAQFHNGGNYYPTGKSIKKFSIFFEKSSNIDMKYTLQNITNSLFPKALNTLSKDGELIITDFEETDYYDLVYLHKEFGVKVLYMIALTDLKNQFVGILQVSFNDESKVLNKWDLEYLRKKANIIGTMLK